MTLLKTYAPGLVVASALAALTLFATAQYSQAVVTPTPSVHTTTTEVGQSVFQWTMDASINRVNALKVASVNPTQGSAEICNVAYVTRYVKDVDRSVPISAMPNSCFTVYVNSAFSLEEITPIFTVTAIKPTGISVVITKDGRHY